MKNDIIDYEFYCERCRHVGFRLEEGYVCRRIGSKRKIAAGCPDFELDPGKETKIRLSEKARQKRRERIEEDAQKRDNVVFQIIEALVGIPIVLLLVYLKTTLWVYPILLFLFFLPDILLLLYVNFLSVNPRRNKYPVIVQNNQIRAIVDVDWFHINIFRDKVRWVHLDPNILRQKELSRAELRKLIKELYLQQKLQAQR